VIGRAAAAPLLGAQLVFNVGFYAVVPFLAIVLRDDYLLSGAAIGLVLGARTFAQQGLFLVGGVLVDALGARRLVLVGCAVRVGGFATLALADDLATFVVGAVLTGLGGALFSPAVETLVAVAEQARPAADGPRATLFAWLTVVGETGAVVGPLVGALLFGWGFSTVAGSGAALFALTAVVLWRVLPADADRPDGQGLRSGLADVLGGLSLRHRTFVLFAVVHSVNLLAWNQLYLGLPVELERVGRGPGAYAALLALVSVVTITLQLPVARLVRRAPTRAVLPLGYALLASAFGVLAVAATLPSTATSLAPVTASVVLLTLGHLVVGPAALDLVPTFAAGRRLGSYYGLLATCGGVAVLALSVPLGALYSAATTTSPAAAAPWALLAGLALTSSLAAAVLLRRPLAAPDASPTAPATPGAAEGPR
jgi:MFS family permease